MSDSKKRQSCWEETAIAQTGGSLEIRDKSGDIGAALIAVAITVGGNIEPMTASRIYRVIIA